MCFCQTEQDSVCLNEYQYEECLLPQNQSQYQKQHPTTASEIRHRATCSPPTFIQWNSNVQVI